MFAGYDPRSPNAHLIAAHMDADAKEFSMRRANAESMAATRMARAFAAEAFVHSFAGPRNTTAVLVPASMAVPGFHEAQKGPLSFFPGPAPESSDEIALFQVTPPKSPEWTAARRNAAINDLCAVSDSSPESANIEAETLRERILTMQARDVDAFAGPSIGDEQAFDAGDAVGEFADYFEGQADFRELCQNGTGRILSVDAAAKRWEAFQLAMQQTHRLADCCELAGLPVYFATPGLPNPEGRPVRPALTLIPAGEPDKAVTMPNVARLNAFPVVQKSRHADMLRWVRWMIQNEPWARMMTVTSGERTRADCTLGNLNAGHKAFRKALGNVMQSRFFKRHARAFFIGTEYGTPKAISPDGILADIHFHIHAHILYCATYRADGRLWSKGQWSRFRRWLRMKLAAEMRGWTGPDRERGITDADGLHCELGKLIENANEACKYPFKGNDLETLIELAGPAGIRTFVEQVKGLNFAQPVGELRKARSKAKLAGQRAVIIQTEDGPIVEIRRNWNLGRFDGYGRRDRTNARAKVRRNLKPEVIERRRRRQLARIAAPVRRDFWALFRLQERMKAAQARANDERNLVKAHHWQQVAAGLEAERAGMFRELRNALENFPASLNAAGVSDYIAAPWFADFRAYLEKTGFRAEYDAEARAGTPDTQNGKQTEKNGQKSEKTGSQKPPLKNHLMARCAPFANGKWRVAQPVFAVIGYTGDFKALAKQSRPVAELAAASADHIAAALRVADASAPLTRASVRAPGRAHHPGSHYPPNSGDAGATWPPTPPLWAGNAPKTADLAALATLN